ncbi:MAG: DUF6265 family protein [Planctomycetota bacterium]
MKMKILTLGLVCGLSFVCVALPLAADGVVKKGGGAESQLSMMAWLSGTWSGDMWGGQFVAYYTTPEGGKVLSYSELRRGEKVAMYEFEKFEVKDGEVWLTPFPRGKQASTFRLTSLDQSQRKATFECPKNDFPTRIVYHRSGNDDLVITLSDPHGGGTDVQTFQLARHGKAKSGGKPAASQPRTPK